MEGHRFKFDVTLEFAFAQVAQLVEHILGKDEVTSSILVLGL